MGLKALNFDNFDNLHNSLLWPEYSIDFFLWKMDPMSGFDIRLGFKLPPRDSTLQYKRCVHLWNNFPCITSLHACKLGTAVCKSLPTAVPECKFVYLALYNFLNNSIFLSILICPKNHNKELKIGIIWCGTPCIRILQLEGWSIVLETTILYPTFLILKRCIFFSMNFTI